MQGSEKERERLCREIPSTVADGAVFLADSKVRCSLVFHSSHHRQRFINPFWNRFSHILTQLTEPSLPETPPLDAESPWPMKQRTAAIRIGGIMRRRRHGRLGVEQRLPQELPAGPQDPLTGNSNLTINQGCVSCSAVLVLQGDPQLRDTKVPESQLSSEQPGNERIKVDPLGRGIFNLGLHRRGQGRSWC